MPHSPPSPAGWRSFSPESAAVGLLVASAAAVPLTLLWDFSWESSIGIDLPWSPPHTALFISMMLAGLAALSTIQPAMEEDHTRLARWHAPTGIWIVLWGVAAFLTATIFDRWWQGAYGLAAGLWGPPQLLKATAFFAVLTGAWMHAASPYPGFIGTLAFPIAGGSLLALVSVVTLPSLYANRQHSAAFYEIAAGTYPIILAAQAVLGRGRFPATMAALCYLVLYGAMVWLLPLFPAEPMVAPILNPLDHLLPPPFPLLLVAPALAVDLLWRVFPARRVKWSSAVEAGLAFLLVFTAVQWSFAKFLLSPAAQGRFFAGGGQHWPFFLHISPAARTQFWSTEADSLDLRSAAGAAALAVIATFAGFCIGRWRKGDQS